MMTPVARRCCRFVVLALTFSCGGRALDLGGDGPRPGASEPPRGLDGAVDETVPFAIVPDVPEAFALAADESRIYWSNGYAGYSRDLAVRSCEIVNCAATTITYPNDQPTVLNLVVTQTSLYWTGLDPEGRILTCPIGGCPAEGPTVVAHGNATIFLVDESQVYIALYDETIVRCPLSGCGPDPEVVAQIDHGVAGMVGDADNLYAFTAADSTQPKSDIVRIRKDGSEPPRVIAASQHHTGAIAVDSERVYWINAYTVGSVMACPLSGCLGEPTIVASEQQNVEPQLTSPMRLLVDEHNVYWINRTGFPLIGEVMECPLTGCGAAPKVLAGGVLMGGQKMTGTGLALDSSHVYWTSSGPDQPAGSRYEGNVRRVAK